LTISEDEEKQKRKAVDGDTLGKQCGPDNLDQRVNPEIDPSVAASYPTGDEARYPYNYENNTHKMRIIYQDGHHPADRWNLTDAQIGVGTQHIHDDWKRSPPEILDQDPSAAKTGYLAHFRVPDSRLVFEQPGDELGLSPEERAKKPKDRLDDGT
jgi:hypothetical protein